jgi:diguanylate cyclase (GGDEF)-like protein
MIDFKMLKKDREALKYGMYQILAVLLLLVLFQYIFFNYKTEKARNDINITANNISQSLHEVLVANFNALFSLGYYFDVENSITEDRFRTLSENYLSQFPDILFLKYKSMEIGAEVDMIYPVQRKEYQPWGELRENMEIVGAETRSTSNRIVTAYDPYEVTSADETARRLVAKYNIKRDGEIRGFFVAVMDLDSVFKSIFEKYSKHYNISVCGSNKVEFYKPQGEHKGETHTEKILVEDNHWFLKVSSKTNSSMMVIMQLLSISFVFIMVFIALLYLEYKIYLKNRNIDELTALKNALDKEVEERKHKEKELSQSYGELSAVYGQLAAAEEALRTHFEELSRNEEKLRTIAYTDPLTNLPNKQWFIDKLGRLVSKKSETGSRIAVISLDIDNFKNINDTLGHEAGDELILQISEKLNESMQDNMVLSRFSGDDFLILISEYPSNNYLKRVIEELRDMFNQFWTIHNNQLYVTVSIGITVYPDDGTDVSDILRNANTAMHKAKAYGKNQYLFYKKSMHQEITRKTVIENALRKALIDEELLLYYQPQVDIKTNKVIGLEALLRWISPELGFISPAEFIPIAEETGFIGEIGKWTIRTACLQNRLWRLEGFDYKTVAVNVSAMEIQTPGFIDYVREILLETGMSPRELEIEITESMLMKSLDTTVEILGELRKLGVKIALDDFGTGYSSLNYLMHIPIDSVKVDKSFIDGICSNSKNKSIAEAITILAHNIELEVIAEGVETMEQLTLLSEMNCDKIQGYIFSKPQSADDIGKMLKELSFNIERQV